MKRGVVCEGAELGWLSLRAESIIRTVQAIKMNRILFENQQDSYRLRAGDPRLEHVRGVLRMQAGDCFDVGVASGPAGRACIESISEGNLVIRVEWGSVPPPPPPLHVLIGLSRPATVRKLLTTLPTLGVRSIHFAGTARSDPAYARSSLWTSGEWRQRLIEGVEQAFDTYLPQVVCHPDLGVALDAFPQQADRLALDVYEGTSRLSACVLSPGIPTVLAVGPERGWAGSDREALRAAGFCLVHLGSRVLRVETAVIAGLTLLLARLGEY